MVLKIPNCFVYKSTAYLPYNQDDLLATNSKEWLVPSVLHW